MRNGELPNMAGQSEAVLDSPIQPASHPAGAGAALVRVATGLHAGAICVLPDGLFSIGSEAPADILLCDDGIAAQHLVIERHGGDIQLSVRGPGVTIEGQALSEGEVVAAALPIDITLGPVTLRCEAASVAGGGPATSVAGWRARLPFAGPRVRTPFAGVAAVLVGALLCGLVLRSTSTEAFVPIRLPQARAPVQSAAPALSDAALRLRTAARLDQLGLTGLDLGVSGGVVELTGTLDADTMPRLHDVELWFDRSFGERAVLLSHVTARADQTPVLALDSVWTGPDPNVIVRGQKYFLGASLPDGSVIDQITPTEVVLRRAGLRYAVSY